MKATRDGVGDQLVISGKDNPYVIGLSADLGKATKINTFGAAYPDRLYEMGIAENNMVGVASGMSEYGYKVFMMLKRKICLLIYLFLLIPGKNLEFKNYFLCLYQLLFIMA